MTLYFKTAYKPFFEQWKSQKKNPSVIPSLIAFANCEFAGLVDTLSEKAKFEFIELLKLLVFSHRHNKNDEYLKDPLIDFTTVREPMYKYSRHAQDKFFDFATFAFLFAWFEANPRAKSFSAEKFAENENTRYPERMCAEISHLGEEAQAKLQAPSTTTPLMTQAATQVMKQALVKYLRTSIDSWTKCPEESPVSQGLGFIDAETKSSEAPTKSATSTPVTSSSSSQTKLAKQRST